MTPFKRSNKTQIVTIRRIGEWILHSGFHWVKLWGSAGAQNHITYQQTLNSCHSQHQDIFCVSGTVVRMVSLYFQCVTHAINPLMLLLWKRNPNNRQQKRQLYKAEEKVVASQPIVWAFSLYQVLKTIGYVVGRLGHFISNFMWTDTKNRDLPNELSRARHSRTIRNIYLSCMSFEDKKKQEKNWQKNKDKKIKIRLN